MPRRHELTDTQWEAIRDRIPGKPGDPGRSGEDNRSFVNAVVYVAKTGIPWRDLPERFGSWNSVWRRFDRWCASGVWGELVQALGDPDLEEVHLDSTSVKAHQSASGSRRKPAEKKRKLTKDVVSGVPAEG
jgi:putative transposase